MVKLLFRF